MKIDTNGIQDFLDKSASAQFNPSKPRSNNDGDASLRISYASLIDQAMEDAETDVDAIRRAQESLLSGELEDPDNIREAAENMIRFGP